MSEVKAAPQGSHKEFVDGYVTCMLWSSTDNSNESGGDPLDLNYDADDLDESTTSSAISECMAFIDANRKDLEEATAQEGYTWARAGHDFWLTRNGHGAGFFDRGLGTVGDRLQDAARLYGGRDPYVGDDGKVYIA